MKRHRDEEPDRAAADAREIIAIDRQLDGWKLTLGDPNLPPAEVRTDITACLPAGQAPASPTGPVDRRRQGPRGTRRPDPRPGASSSASSATSPTSWPGSTPPSATSSCRATSSGSTASPTAASRCAAPTWASSKGPPSCSPARIPSRPGAGDRPPTASPPSSPAAGAGSDVPNLSADSTTPTAKAIGGGDTSLDPARFAGLPEPFFWTESLVIEKALSWAQANAAEVVRLRLSGLTMGKLAEHCGKTTPTIREALKHGKAAQPDLELPRKVARALLVRGPRRRGDGRSSSAG